MYMYMCMYRQDEYYTSDDNTIKEKGSFLSNEDENVKYSNVECVCIYCIVYIGSFTVYDYITFPRKCMYRTSILCVKGWFTTLMQHLTMCCINFAISENNIAFLGISG